MFKPFSLTEVCVKQRPVSLCSYRNKEQSSQLCVCNKKLRKPTSLFCSFTHVYTVRESRSFDPAYKYSPYNLLIIVPIKLHTITVWCGGMATTGQAQKGRRRDSGSRLEWEQGDKQGKAHNPPVYSVQTKPAQQWHTKRGQESLKYVLKKMIKESFLQKNKQHLLHCEKLFSELNQKRNNKVNMSCSCHLGHSAHKFRGNSHITNIIQLEAYRSCWYVIMKVRIPAGWQRRQKLFVKLSPLRHQLLIVVTLKNVPEAASDVSLGF